MARFLLASQEKSRQLMFLRVQKYQILVSICASLTGQAFSDTGVIKLDTSGLAEEVSEDLEEALRDFEPPKSRLEARRHARRAAQLTKKQLNAAGYFNPVIETGVAREPPFQAWLRVEAGALFILDEITYAYEGQQPSDETRLLVESAGTLKPSDAAIPEALLIEKQRLETAYLNRGFADIKIDEPDLLADRETASVNLTFPIITGPLTHLGVLEIIGTRETKDSFINRLAPFDRGDLYTPQILATLNRRLSSTRHYRDIIVELGDATQDDTTSSTERPVRITLEERPRHTISLGGSIATDQGVGGLIEWTRWNLTGQADPLTVSAQASQIEQSLGADWRLPHFPKPGRQLSLTTRAFNEDTDAFNRAGLTLGGAFEFAGSARTIWTFGGDYEIADERGEVEDRLQQTLTVSSALRLDRSDSLTDPTHGWRATISTQPGFSFGDDEAAFLRNLGQVSAYLPLSKSKRWVFASRIELGSVIGADTATLPVDERFFAGGGASVRGFGFQELGPRDAEGNPLGGRSLFETSAELRGKLTKRIGFATFVDAGSVSDSAFPEFNNLQVGAGAGLRYDTPAGPIRLDIAVPVNPTEFDRDFQINF